jgi:putative membrane protein
MNAKRSVTATVAVAGFAVLLSSAAVSKEDSKAFLTKAIEGDNSEVMLGRLAEQKAASQGVRDFGHTLVTDHGAHKEKVAALARSNGVAIPDGPTKDAQKEHDKLAKLSGNDFDKEFVSFMVKDHKDDIQEYTEESKAKDNGEVAKMAQQTIPALEKHLSMAQDLDKKMKK